MLLSNVLAHKEGAVMSKVRTGSNQISPVAWQRINFFRRYEFRKSPEFIDFDAICGDVPGSDQFNDGWLSWNMPFRGRYAKIPMLIRGSYQQLELPIMAVYRENERYR